MKNSYCVVNKIVDITKEDTKSNEKYGKDKHNKIIKLEDPLDIDDDKIHIEQHTKFIIKDNSINDPKFVTSLLKHIQKHKEKINKDR